MCDFAKEFGCFSIVEWLTGFPANITSARRIGASSQSSFRIWKTRVKPEFDDQQVWAGDPEAIRRHFTYLNHFRIVVKKCTG
jgi:hypothetical protein